MARSPHMILESNVSIVAEEEENIEDSAFANECAPNLLNSTFKVVKEQAEAILQSPNIKVVNGTPNNDMPTTVNIEYIIDQVSERLKVSLKAEKNKFFEDLEEQIFQRVDEKVTDLLQNTTAAVDISNNGGCNWQNEFEQRLIALELKVGQGLDKLNAMLESNSIAEITSLIKYPETQYPESTNLICQKSTASTMTLLSTITIMMF